MRSLYRQFVERLRGVAKRNASPQEDQGADRLARLIEGSLKNPFSFEVDTVDACNLRCVHCPRGVHFQNNTSARMTPEFFNRMLDKMTEECRCKGVDLYNWSEPFLHPELAQLVMAVQSRHILCGLSSNLSLTNRARLEAVLRQSPNSLIVSVSGFTQEVHERYHKGSNVETVKDNLRFIADFRKDSGLFVNVRIHCLQFVDNREDQVLWEQFCKEYGFVYHSLPACCSEVTTPETAGRLLDPPGFYTDADGRVKVQMVFSETPRFDPCPLHNTVPINARGDVYLCCIYWNRDEYRIGGFLDNSLASLQEKRFLHPHCSGCMVFRK